MARTAIAVTTIAAGPTLHAAVTEATADTSNGNSLVNPDGRTILLVRNASGSSINITITSVADPDTGRTGDIGPQAVANGALRAFGPFPPHLFNQSDGTVSVTSSASTGVNVSAVRPAN